MTATLDAGTDLQEQARRAYRESVARDAPLSRQALGDMFGRSPSWARDRIAEAQRGAGTTPPKPVSIEAVTTTAGAGVAPVVTGGVTRTRAKAATPKPKPPTPPTADPAPHRADTPAAPAAPVSLAGARFMAWVGFAFGSLVSVAANWLAAWLPATDMPPDWAPTAATQIGAAVWPVALLVSVEVMSRTAWPTRWYWTLLRIGGIGVVALGSGVISYGHIRAVLTSWGYDPIGAGVGPLVIDGLMVVSGFALLAISHSDRKE